MHFPRSYFALARALAGLRLAALICAAATVAAPSQPSAAEGTWQKSDQSDARLISAANAVGDSKKLDLGVELKLRDGWKTYWRTPGDAGLPPSVDWSGSENFQADKLEYPAPQRFQLLGLQTVGYAKHVIFPVEVELKDAGKAFEGKAQVNVLVCEKICIPQTFNLSLSLPAGPATPGDEAQALNRFQSSVPGDGRAAGLTLESANAIAKSDGIEALQIVAKSRDGFSRPDVFAEVKAEAAFAHPDVALSSDRTTATITLPLTMPLPAGSTLADQPAVLTLVDGPRSAEFQTKVTQGSGAALGTSGFASLGSMIGIALLGGLILNFMPCVLPILSIKIVSFAKESGRASGHIRAGMIATAAGIIASMLAIAGVLIALKSAGIAIGWGIQFQQPLFIAAMALILVLFACNFWDFFEVALPGSITNYAATSGGDGQSMLSNFLIGAFATLLATPCSAPFVGTAVGFALGQGTMETLSIFAALGVGLALPYLAVAAAPGIARLMPRPGVWMEWLRRAMGFALALTAAWLVSVLAGQIGVREAAIIALALLALIVCLVVAKLWPKLQTPMFATAACLAIVTLLSGAFAGRMLGHGEDGNDRIAWQPLQQDQIKSLVAQGKTVFVDVTADWCLTCKANKRFVLEQSPLVDRIAMETVAMKGDWTSPDPKITAFLARFGKYGVPFNVVFGPGSPSGIALPELLTQQAVTAAIEKAAGGG